MASSSDDAEGGGLAELGEGHRGQTKFRKGAPGPRAHGEGRRAFGLAKIQSSIRQPLRDQHNKNGNQAVELNQPSGQRMQLSLLGWIRPRTHCRTDESLSDHDRTRRQPASGEVVRLPMVSLWVEASRAREMELAALG